MRTRRSTTGVAAHHAKHLIEAASTTQTVIALSSGESEFLAIARGTVTALGTKSMARDCGHEVNVTLEIDMLLVRHVDTQWLLKQTFMTKFFLVRKPDTSCKTLHEGQIVASAQSSA